MTAQVAEMKQEPLVEIFVDGRLHSVAGERLGHVVCEAIHLKRQIKEAEARLKDLLDEIQARVGHMGIKARPVSLVPMDNSGRVIVKRSESVSIIDLAGLQEALGAALCDLISARPKKELLAVARDGEHPLAEKVRGCLAVEEKEGVIVKVKM